MKNVTRNILWWINVEVCICNSEASIASSDVRVSVSIYWLISSSYTYFTCDGKDVDLVDNFTESYPGLCALAAVTLRIGSANEKSLYNLMSYRIGWALSLVSRGIRIYKIACYVHWYMVTSKDAHWYMVHRNHIIFFHALTCSYIFGVQFVGSIWK